MSKLAPAVAVVLLLVAPSVSQAKGCIKGALIGGVAGHLAGHHGLLGAAAGCIIGRRQAHVAQKAAADPEHPLGRAPAPASIKLQR